MPENDFISRKEYNIDRDKATSRMNELESKITRLETHWENWNGLPQAIQSISTTMAVMDSRLGTLENELKSLARKFEELIERNDQEKKDQDDEIKSIDDKSKVDVTKWISNNWFKIVTTIAVISLLVKDFIVK